MYFYSTQILKKRNSKEGHSITKEQRNNNHNQSHVSIQETMEKETSNLSKDSVVASEKQESGDKTASKGSVVDWRVSFPDEDVSIVFKQGNCYEGRISRKMLEGYGCFKWTDGSCYKGEFVNGEMIGHGILEWPDQSWYEGEVYRGHRHGHGIYVTNEKNVTYYGGWYMGVKHGEGIIYYGNKGDNYYEGEFLNGLYNGIGYRQYPTGARYIGEWKSGLCHGTGTMVWPNNDVYYGNWECGTKTGYGTYMWDVITSSELVMTSIDVYQGYWQNDLRHGKGSLIKQCGNRILAENTTSYVDSVHEPFERILFWQFLQYLLEVSWLLYASKGIGYKGAPGILGSAFIKLVREDILPNAGNHEGKALFKYRDILPLEAVLMLYKNIGQSHSARDFLIKTCIRKGESIPWPLSEENFAPCWYPDHIRNGKNAMYIGGYVIYLPGPEPITYSKTIPEDRNPPQDSQLPMDDPLATQLISFCKLGPTKVTDYLTEVCPAIISEDLICNMDYKLTFLEFYEVLLLCAEGLLRMQATEATKLAKLEVKNQYDSNVTAEDTKTTKIISNSNNTLNRATNKKKKYKS
ncbi:uncharacterized protein [Periplaneta americana]|uniref:uncharacterized protein isoform X3 n=1 Tax=Periplaneta americana TaxID=6978 RepID=UPI0037E72245